MDMIDRETLIALFDNIIEGLARMGCGMVGLPYPVTEDDDENK